MRQWFINYTGTETCQLDFCTFVKTKFSQNFPAITLKGIAVSAQYMYIAPVTLHAKIVD